MMQARESSVRIGRGLRVDSPVRRAFVIGTLDMKCLTLSIGVFVGLLCTVFSQSTWPQWRGPERTGAVDKKSAAWPENLKGLADHWSVELSEGYPGPIVSEDKVFTVETKKKADEIVRAFDRKTGIQLWEHSWAGSLKVPFFARANGSWVRSTPAYDDGRLYVGGIRDVLVCLDTDTGLPVWTVDLKDRFDAKVPGFGMVCSPLVVGEHVYVQAGGGFCKLDKQTGATIWRGLNDGGGMYGSAFSSPVMATLHGKQQLLVQTRTLLTGVDPDTGKALWSQNIKAFRGMNIQTPTPFGDQVFTSSYGGGSFLVKLDPKPNDVIHSEFAWSNKTEGYMSSPLLIDNHIYMHLRSERFICMDPNTGETKWTSPKSMGKYMSLVYQGDTILGLNHTGTLTLLKSNPDKMEVLDSNRVSQQQTWAHLAVADDQVFVRELKGLKVLRWRADVEL